MLRNKSVGQFCVYAFFTLTGVALSIVSRVSSASPEGFSLFPQSHVYTVIQQYQNLNQFCPKRNRKTKE